MVGSEDGSAFSLDEFVGDAFGDYGSPAEATPDAGDTPDDATGAPPAEHPAPNADAVSPPEGTESDAHAGAPPADAAAPIPEAVVDPLADAKPLTYTVNGEQRTYDGVKVLGTDGAIIDAAALPDLMRRLGERDHLFETNKAQYNQVQQFERLSEWRTTDAEGKELIYRGQDGLMAQRVELARAKALVATVDAMLSDPERFAEIIGVTPDGKIQPDPRAMEHLLMASRYAMSEAEKSERISLLQASQPPQAQSQAPDFSKAAPAIIAQAAGANADLLTAEDRLALEAAMPRYVRATTPQDVQGNPSLRVGAPIIDASYASLVSQFTSIRSQAKATATAATSASTDNARKLAAAFVQRPTPVKAAPVPKAPSSRQSDAEAAWALRERLANGRIGAA